MSPTRRGLALLVAWAVLGVAASLEPSLAPAWSAVGLLLAVVAVADLAWVLAAAPPPAARRAPAALSMGVWTPITLTVRNPSRRRLSLRVHDAHPPGTVVRDLPARLDVPPRGAVELRYGLRPERRGEHRFGRAWLRLRSPLGLFERHLRGATEARVRAYPNFRAAAGYELLAVENRTGALGIRRRPRRGEGLDFHQLREYRAGDSLRQIDWKATARLRRPISREYQDQRDQQLLFLLDCGRRLHSLDGGRSHFDAALDALLLVAHVALRQGDAFGLMTFSGERRWLAPRKGTSHLNAVLNSVFDLETSAQVSDFGAAAREVALRVRKRSLVVILSNLRDEDASELRGALRLLSRRHLVLLASLREGVVMEALERPVGDLEAALRLGAAQRYLDGRAQALATLQRSGAVLLESDADDLPVALANRYLDVKAAGLL